jgi:hypothetical protein
MKGTSGARKLKTLEFVLVEALENVAAQIVTRQEKGGQSLTDRSQPRGSLRRMLQHYVE